MTKKLKLWNGRLQGYKHGYIAAYSQADAIRLAEENFGLRGWLPEIRDYWSEGAWGDSMIGVTPRRGLFAETKDSQLVEFVNHKPIVIERDDPQAWEAHQASQRAKREAYESMQSRSYQERCERAERLERVLNVGTIERVKDRIEFVFEGNRYRVEDLGPDA